MQTVTDTSPRHNVVTAERFNRLFRQCPGAWIGAEPTDTYPGHITVDARKIIPALRFLAKRRIPIATTRTSPSEPGGIQLRFLAIPKGWCGRRTAIGGKVGAS